MKKMFLFLLFIVAAYSYMSTPETYFSGDGGFCVRLSNRTGAASVRGAKLALNPDYPFSATNSTTGTDFIGVSFQTGIANGAPLWVVVWGQAMMLIQSNVICTNNYDIYLSTNSVVILKKP